MASPPPPSVVLAVTVAMADAAVQIVKDDSPRKWVWREKARRCQKLCGRMGRIVS